MACDRPSDLNGVRRSIRAASRIILAWQIVPLSLVCRAGFGCLGGRGLAAALCVVHLRRAVRAGVADVPDRTVKRERWLQRQGLADAGKERQRGVDVQIGQPVAPGARVAVVRPAFARELFIEADHLVLCDVVVGRQEQERRRAAERVHRLHRSSVSHDEPVDIEQAARSDEARKVAAVREADQKAPARARALLRGREGVRPAVDERGPRVRVVLVTRPAVPGREIRRRARAEAATKREHREAERGRACGEASLPVNLVARRGARVPAVQIDDERRRGAGGARETSAPRMGSKPGAHQSAARSSGLQSPRSGGDERCFGKARCIRQYRRRGCDQRAPRSPRTPRRAARP